MTREASVNIGHRRPEGLGRPVKPDDDGWERGAAGLQGLATSLFQTGWQLAPCDRLPRIPDAPRPAV